MMMALQYTVRHGALPYTRLSDVALSAGSEASSKVAVFHGENHATVSWRCGFYVHATTPRTSFCCGGAWAENPRRQSAFQHDFPHIIYSTIRAVYYTHVDITRLWLSVFLS